MKPIEIPITAQAISGFIEIYNAVAGTTVPTPIEPFMPQKQEQGSVIFVAYDNDGIFGRWGIQYDVDYAKYDSVMLWHEDIDISWFKVGMMFRLHAPTEMNLTVGALVQVSKVDTERDELVLSRLDGLYDVKATPWGIFGFFTYEGKGKTLPPETKGKADE